MSLLLKLLIANPLTRFVLLTSGSGLLITTGVLGVLGVIGVVCPLSPPLPHALSDEASMRPRYHTKLGEVSFIMNVFVAPNS